MNCSILRNKLDTVLLGQDIFDLIAPKVVFDGINNLHRTVQTKLASTIADPIRQRNSLLVF